ncbi:MAG: YdcF family protein [Devosia sp.]
MPARRGDGRVAPPLEVPALFPYVTRIFWLIAQPVSLAVILLIIGFALSWLKRRWPSRLLVGAALLLLILCCFTSFGYLLINPLEDRFVRPAEPERIDGIVVLGGAMESETTATRGVWEFNRSGDRFVETLRLAQQHPEARIVIAAGPGALVPDQYPEALAAERFFLDFGIAPERLFLDQRSRNTEENAQFARELSGDTGTETWLLVTSAFHMPRSVGLFRRAGFPVIPWPADYLSTGRSDVTVLIDQPSENLSVATMALREWTALAGYYLTGRIDELLPGP